MFGWLKNIIKNWICKDDLSIYMPKERKLFSYFNGEKLIREDPMTLYFKMMEVGPELAIDIKVAVSPMKDADDFRKKAYDKMRSVFGVNRHTPDTPGLTDLETIDLFSRFQAYLDDLKKNVKSTPTPVEETLVPSVSSSVENQPTSSSLHSGSPVNGFSTEKSKSSDSASPQPTVPMPPNLSTSNK